MLASGRNAMFAWRILVSFLFGVTALYLTGFGVWVLERIPQYAVCSATLFIAALLSILASMSFAQDDGSVRGKSK